MTTNRKKNFTGKLTYNNFDFTFIFDGDSLLLIPSDKDIDKINKWFSNSVKDGYINITTLPQMEDAYLFGENDRNETKIIFITEKGSLIDCYDSMLVIKIIAYIKLEGSIRKFDSLSFYGPEINAIYPVNQAIDYENCDYDNDVINILTKKVEKTTSIKSTFNIAGKDITVFWVKESSIQRGITEYPVRVRSALVFEFESTEDFTFAYTLWQIAKKFINYLCYRKNTLISDAILSGSPDSDPSQGTAYLKVLGKKEAHENQPISEMRYIRQSLIAGKEGKILYDIANKKLYMRHFPKTYQLGMYEKLHRTLAITAAFEQECLEHYPELFLNNDESNRKDDDILSCKNEFMHISNTQKKKIDNMSIAEKIPKILANFDSIINIFASYIYGINGVDLDYEKVTKRIVTYRNTIAHGKSIEVFDKNVIIDLYLLEQIVYVMQLRHYQIDDINIQRSIDCLFHYGILIN